jgi:hypothetical protein
MRKDIDSPVMMVKEGEYTSCGFYVPYGVVTNADDNTIYEFLSETVKKNLEIIYKFICSHTHEGYICLVHKEASSIADVNELKHSLNETILKVDLNQDDIKARIIGLSSKLNSIKDEKNVGEGMYILYKFLPEKLKKELKIYIKQ